jgi:TatD DNase family protein
MDKATLNLIDSHAHLTHKDLFGRLDEVLANAKAAGVNHIISIACDADEAEKALAIARVHNNVSATAGIHPHEAAKVSQDVMNANIDRVSRLLEEREVVAVGEIGLDYYYDFADRETQMRVFAGQLEMASGHDLPLIIHCREAFDDTIALLEQHGYHNKRVVFHCFTGTKEEAQRVADHGWRISFTGIVTFKKLTELQDIARAYPADELMVETDSPYLSPVPVRHVHPNEPAHVAHTLRFLAALRGDEPEALAAQTTANTRAFFRLP